MGMIALSSILPNPFRDFTINPLVESRVMALLQSITESGLWKEYKFPVRGYRNGAVQLATGHHRLEAARRFGLSSVECELITFTDAQMLYRMTRENFTQGGNTPAAVLEAVAMYAGTVAYDVLTYDPNKNQRNNYYGGSVKADQWNSFVARVRNDGPGKEHIYRELNGFEYSEKGDNRETVGLLPINSALSTLKQSGRMHEIMTKVYARIEAEQAAELKRIETMKENQRLAEVARLKRVAEEAATAKTSAEKAEAKRKADAEAANRAKEVAAEKELSRVAAEAAAKLEQITKTHTQRAVDKKYDDTVVALFGDNPSWEKAFRTWVLKDGPRIPFDMQYAFVQQMLTEMQEDVIRFATDDKEERYRITADTITSYLNTGRRKARSTEKTEQARELFHSQSRAEKIFKVINDSMDKIVVALKDLQRMQDELGADTAYDFRSLSQCEDLTARIAKYIYTIKNPQPKKESKHVAKH